MWQTHLEVAIIGLPPASHFRWFFLTCEFINFILIFQSCYFLYILIWALVHKIKNYGRAFRF